jgi:hypothetical protein
MAWRRALIAGVVALGLVGMARADVDPAEYELKSSLRSEKERQQMKARLEAEKKVEEEMRRQAEAEEARRRAEERARLEARPYPVKLTERQCTRCHVAANYENQNHTLLGWWLVVLRMEHFNQAEFGPGEKSVIVSHLSATRPADTGTRLQEYGLLLAGASGLALLVWGGIRLRRYRRGRPGAHQ